MPSFSPSPPSHNTWDEKEPKHVHMCAEFCKRLVDALYHTHSRGIQSKGLVCFRSSEDAATPNTRFATDTRPFVQTLKRFTCGVHVLHGVSPTEVVDGELITSDRTKNTWILLELNSSFDPREECAYHMYDLRPWSPTRMLSRALDLWSDDMTNLFAVTRSNGWFSTSAQDRFNIMEDLLMLRLPFLQARRHTTLGMRKSQNTSTCVPNFANALWTHSTILTQEASNPRALCVLDPLRMLPRLTLDLPQTRDLLFKRSSTLLVESTSFMEFHRPRW